MWTSVDFTRAVTVEPTVMPSCSTDSRVTTDTTWCGPDRISTRAATSSSRTAVTIPAKEFRTELSAVPGGNGCGTAGAALPPPDPPPPPK